MVLYQLHFNSSKYMFNVNIETMPSIYIRKSVRREFDFIVIMCMLLIKNFYTNCHTKMKPASNKVQTKLMWRADKKLFIT